MTSPEAVKGDHRTEPATPAPDDPRKPEDPGDLTKRSWFYVLRKTFHEFGEDQCTDLAAALTYYAVLAIFPAMLALISVLGVIGQAPRAVRTGRRHAAAPGLRPDPRPRRAGPEPGGRLPGAGVALVVGVLVALWSASGYVGAFGRAMNRIYEIEEGRPFWKLRPIMLLLTLVAVVLAAIALLMLIVSGPVAESIGNVIGLGDTALTVWSIAKWPILALIVVLVVGAALLRDAQRPAAEVPLDLGRCRRRHPGLGARLGRVRLLRRRTSPATTRPTARWRASS